jgi:hypothetical protein
MFYKPIIKMLLLLSIMIILALINSCQKSTEPDNNPPSVLIMSPSNGESVNEIVEISVSASDEDGIKKLILVIDGNEIEDSEITEEPYIFYWNTIEYEDSTSHSIAVKAYDNNNNFTNSETISLVVDNSGARPTQISISSVKHIANYFIVKWNMSIDQDFGGYALFISNASDMSDMNQIYSSENPLDTVYTVSNIQPNEIKYFKIVVNDKVGLTTDSPIIKAIYVEYIEGFENSLGTSSYEEVGATNSYYKELNDGWMVYAEDTYGTAGVVDTGFDWLQEGNAFSGSFCIKGTTSTSGRGDVWLYKYFPVLPGLDITVSVYMRTTKQHIGEATGPSLHVFDGMMNYPTQNAVELLGWERLLWEYDYVSPWTNITVPITSKQDYITVGLKVHDGWDSNPIYGDFDNLVIVSE